jgi:CRP/FNR family transcriptional regulator, cyclic AMP receptor protein
MIIPHKSDPAFESLSRAIKSLINGLAPSHVYPATIELYRQGSHAEEVYFINGGLLKLVRSERDGHELIVDLRPRGWLVGAAAVITRQQHPVTAIALSESVIQRIPAEVFNDLLRTNKEFSLHVHQMQSHEAIDHITHLARISCLPAQERLADLLWELAHALELTNSSDEVPLRLPLKHWELAQLISVTPEYLSRLLKKMQQDGIVRQNKGLMIIQNLKKLWHSSADQLSH